VAVFAPAAESGFDFDEAIQRAMEIEHGDDCEGYAIEPVLPELDPLVSASPMSPPAALPPMPACTAPPTPSPSVTVVRSRHAPPKAGTAEQAYRKAKGKARQRLNDQKRRDTATSRSSRAW